FDDRAKQRLKSMRMLSDETGTLTADALQSFRTGLREIKAPVDVQFQKVRDIARDLHKDESLVGMLACLSKTVLDKVLGVAKDEERGTYAPRLQGADDDTEYVAHARKLLSER